MTATAAIPSTTPASRRRYGPFDMARLRPLEDEGRTARSRTKLPPASHPIVRTPETGATSIYLGSPMDTIESLPRTTVATPPATGAQ